MKKVKIYQVKDFENCNWIFRGYECMLKKNNGTEEGIDKAYELVYACERDDNYSLDDCFREFNTNRPNDFKGHSLSVSDIVTLDGEGFYCDNFGWEKLSEKTSTLLDLNDYIKKNYKPKKVGVVKDNEFSIMEVEEVDYKLMHDTVEGYIEYVPFPTFNKKGIDVIVNEEGKLINLDTSIAITNDNEIIEVIKGNVLFVKHDGEDNDGLTAEQLQFIEHLFSKAYRYYDLSINKSVFFLNYDDNDSTDINSIGIIC